MTEVQRIRNDVFRAAQLSGVDYSEAIIDRVFESFGDKFTNQIVDLKTTTKPLPKRGLFFRYMEENENCFAWDRACQSGLLPNQGRQVSRLVPEISENFPLMADGIDFEVNYGLSKIWQFTKSFLPIEEAFKISSLPKSVITYTKFFEKYYLRHIRIVATDYQNNSMNLYFHVDHPKQKDVFFYKSFLQDLNFKEPSDELLQQLVNTVEIAVTFTWKSPAIERVCFYIPGFTRKTASTQLDNLSIKNFIVKCPILLDSPNLILGFSFGKAESNRIYTKIDIDYNGKTVPLFLKIHEQSLGQLCS